MGKLTKIERQCLDTSKRYAKAYSYQVSSSIEPILIYKNIDDPKHVYHIANPEVCKMRYVAEAIYAMFHERDKKQIIIEHVSKNQSLRIEFYPTDHQWDIFRKLLRIEESYFVEKGMK